MLPDLSMSEMIVTGAVAYMLLKNKVRRCARVSPSKLRTAASQDLPKLSQGAGRAVGRMLRNLREVCRHRVSAA